MDKSIDVFKPSVQEVLSFLTAEFDKNLSHNSINCTRSALSLIVDYDLAQDERVKRFFKGVSKIRPARPKYNCTWDPKIVLDYFKSQHRTTEMSLEEQSCKLITLLALVTGHRMQTFSLIKIENIQIFDTKVVIKIPAPIKTSRKNFSQPMLVLPFYEDQSICPAFSLIKYMDSTKNIRGTITNLFISTKKPFRSVTSQTLSRWVKQILTESGVDTTIFSSHSTRHASTSAAKRSGINIEHIRETAGWSKNSETFAKFYDRNIAPDNNQFALSILNA